MASTNERRMEEKVKELESRLVFAFEKLERYEEMIEECTCRDGIDYKKKYEEEEKYASRLRDFCEDIEVECESRTSPVCLRSELAFRVVALWPDNYTCPPCREIENASR